MGCPLRYSLPHFQVSGFSGVRQLLQPSAPAMFLVPSMMMSSPWWKRRIKVANEAGFDYWKVDWGKEDRNGEWRRRLTSMGKRYAPHLYIEHALRNEFIEFSDVFRTYDVENIMAQPITIQRICDLLPYKTVNGAKGIINCEDEPYIAVGLF